MNRRAEENERGLSVSVIIFLLMLGLALFTFTFLKDGAEGLKSLIPFMDASSSQSNVGENPSHSVIAYNLVTKQLEVFDNGWISPTKKFKILDKEYDSNELTNELDSFWFSNRKDTLLLESSGPKTLVINGMFKGPDEFKGMGNTRAISYIDFSLLNLAQGNEDFIFNFDDKLHWAKKSSVPKEIIGKTLVENPISSNVKIEINANSRGYENTVGQLRDNLIAFNQNFPREGINMHNLFEKYTLNNGFTLNRIGDEPKSTSILEYQVYLDEVALPIYIKLRVIVFDDRYELFTNNVLVAPNANTEYTTAISGVPADKVNEIRDKIKEWRDSRLKNPIILDSKEYCVEKTETKLIIDLSKEKSGGDCEI